MRFARVSVGVVIYCVITAAVVLAKRSGLSDDVAEVLYWASFAVFLGWLTPVARCDLSVLRRAASGRFRARR
jgi:hypothetical protein